MRTTRLVYTKERSEQRWAYGHVSAVRDSEGVRLEVNTSGSHAMSSPALNSQQATWSAHALLAAAANTDGAECAGMSILELTWDRLMSVMDRLMTGTEAEDGRDPGRAEGLAYAIAVMSNPYLPNIDTVREVAVERWYAENPDD